MEEQEQTLGDENWQTEADAVVRDVKDHLQFIGVSDVLKSSNNYIYLNVRTKEMKDFCVQLSGSGFRIVGNAYDRNDIDTDDWFETPYNLLNSVSPLFTVSFGETLTKKLNDLSKEYYF